jgi:hypothetical protein
MTYGRFLVGIALKHEWLKVKLSMEVLEQNKVQELANSILLCLSECTVREAKDALRLASNNVYKAGLANDGLLNLSSCLKLVES